MSQILIIFNLFLKRSSYSSSYNDRSGSESENSDFNSGSELNAVQINNDDDSVSNEKFNKKEESDDESRSIKKPGSVSTCSSSRKTIKTKNIDANLKPFQLVWAKCVGKKFKI